MFLPTLNLYILSFIFSFYIFHSLSPHPHIPLYNHIVHLNTFFSHPKINYIFVFPTPTFTLALLNEILQLINIKGDICVVVSKSN